MTARISLIPGKARGIDRAYSSHQAKTSWHYPFMVRPHTLPLPVVMLAALANHRLNSQRPSGAPHLQFNRVFVICLIT
jgi:hypothetical protein